MIAPLPYREYGSPPVMRFWVIGGRGEIKGAFRNACRDLAYSDFGASRCSDVRA